MKKYEPRTKQVQFRMHEKLFKAFKLALATDDKSMTDVLNEAVKEYIKRQGIDLLNPLK
ncbi:MAG: copy number control protein [Clostridia bacterium]|nr:copy number control protein [Clostridia bacterium]